MLKMTQCSMADLSLLQKLAIETFDETFRPLNTEETMRAYLDFAFHPDKLRSELSQPASRFTLLYVDHQLAGYLKLNEAPAQTDLNDPESLEIERIYLRKIFQGRGLGGALLQKAADTAREMGKSHLWLGVWEKNEPAIAFYRKHGFYQIGTHDFIMGEERQRDLVMRKDL